MKLVILFDKFLKKGFVGDIYLGAEKKLVLAIAGMPQEYNHANYNRATIWRYGGFFEFLFDNEAKVAAINLEIHLCCYEDSPLLPEVLVFQDYFPKKGTTLSQFVEFLNFRNIKYSLISHQLSDDTLRILVNEQTIAIFDNNNMIISVECSSLT